MVLADVRGPHRRWVEVVTDSDWLRSDPETRYTPRDHLLACAFCGSIISDRATARTNHERGHLLVVLRQQQQAWQMYGAPIDLTPIRTHRIAVFGGRDYSDAARVDAALEALARKYPPRNPRRSRLVIVTGGAPGADRLAEIWCALHPERAENERHPADWNRHGCAAGPIRNQEMVDSGLDGAIEFPGGAGTADMRRRLEAAGVPIWKR